MIKLAKIDEIEHNILRIINLFYNLFKNAKNAMFVNNEKQIVISTLKEIFPLKDHFFSYENFLVYKIHNKVVAIATAYLHEEMELLKIKSLKLIKNKINNVSLEDLEFFDNLSNEKELYLDALAVAKDYQSKGIGTALIDYLVSDRFKKGNSKYLSLNVYNGNKKALKLYTRLNFKETNKTIINGNNYLHMVRPMLINN